MDMAAVRVLLVGAGGMGRSHLRNLLALRDVEIAGIVDPSSAAIAATKQLYGGMESTPEFSSLKAALETVQADAAVIVTPHAQHFEQGQMCLQRGLHVLMEKPFVAGSVNARALIEMAQQAGRHLAVSYQRRLQGPYVYLKTLIESGELGEIRYATAYQAQSWLESQRGTWRQNRGLSCGGQLNDSGSHLVDVMLWLIGRQPKSVFAHTDNRGTEVDIDSALTIRFEHDVICTLNVVGSASIQWWEDVAIHGSKGTALYRNGELLVAKGVHSELHPVAVEDLPVTTNLDENFIDLVLGRISSPAATAESGYQVARLTEAAWESSEQQRWIAF
ncbi:oxidoreductase [Alicyclobacillus tengchongensis]|nr:oxidoreductase [Alicyclobacillus tengchongensis]